MAQKESKYSKLLQQSQQEKELKEVEFQVKEASLQLESDILATKKSLASKESLLSSLKGKFPLDANSIVKAQVEVEGLEDGLKRLEALQKELF